MRTHALAIAAILALPGLLRGGASKESPTILAPVVVSAPPVPLVKLDLPYRLHTARFAAAAVADGPFIYVIGGSNSSDTRLTEIERFDVRTGKSEPFAELKVGRRNHRAVVHDGKIYVLGGLAEMSFPTDLAFEGSVEVVDLATRKVSAAPRMPEARANFGCALFDGKIYVLGGARVRGSAITHTNTTQVFDLGANQWAKGVPMPTPRMAAAAVVDGGFIIVPGGVRGVREVADVEVFNPREKTWSILPKLRDPVSANSVSFIGHYLFLFGNHELVAYDLYPKQSHAYQFEYRAAQDATAVISGGRIYVIGGSMTAEPITMEDYFHTAPPREPGAKPEVGKKVFDDRAAISDIQVFELRSVTTEDRKH